ncbi:MAG TPA: bifunctional diguanylate cyclase/phosphodiesterase [Cellulomonas sp.]
MSPHSSWRRSDRGRALADLVSDPVVVLPTEPCAVVDVGFRTTWTAGSVLVAPREPGGGHGLVARKDFLTTMTGRYGFGRSLWARRPVAEIARWDVPRVAVGATLTQAAERLVEGDGWSDMVVTGADGVPVGILDPTTLMEALAAELAHEASHDHLTGVTSRAAFVEALRDQCAAARDGDGAVVLAFLDLDRLKAVNDTLGHPAGDALLASVARRILACTRPGDAVGRLGGDEFAVARLLPAQEPDGPWRDQALVLGEALRAALAATDPDLPRSVRSAVSVGLAIGAGTLVDDDRLLREADQAMYGAKKAGGNRVRLAGADLPVPPAWDSLGLEVHYQPIVSTADGLAHEVEALLRSRSADGELGGPAEPLGRADHEGRALDLDLWVLARACADLAGWQTSAGDLAPHVVNVNLSPAALAAPGLAARVLAVLDGAGTPHTSVRLEVSEAATEHQVELAGPELAALRAAGVPIALDDLGAAVSGIAGLRQVARLEVDVLKIDRAVIAGMLADPVDALLVELLHRLAVTRGLTVVAEGVERPEQLDALRAAGVPFVQGYLTGRPMPSDALVDYLVGA